jgi:5-aminopentanamidase
LSVILLLGGRITLLDGGFYPGTLHCRLTLTGRIFGDKLSGRVNFFWEHFFMDPFRIALAQLEPALFDKAKNLAKAEEAIRQAAGHGAAAILFPELFLTGYSLGERAVEMAEPREGASIKRVAELAGLHRIAVLMGFAELSENGRQAYDSVAVANAQGRLAGTYRKIHLFHEETGWFLPGDQPTVLDFGLGPAGLMICYDLEFPEAARQLVLRGAGWLASCTGNMLPNQHLQEIFLQSRAAENHVWVAVANRVGREGALDFFGGSGVADPFGVMTARAGPDETILYADIDPERAERARSNADYLADRRPEIYHMKTE